MGSDLGGCPAPALGRAQNTHPEEVAQAASVFSRHWPYVVWDLVHVPAADGRLYQLASRCIFFSCGMLLSL